MKIIEIGSKGEIKKRYNEHQMPYGLDYSLLFKHCDQGICITDEFGNVEYINDPYCKIFHIKVTPVEKVNILKDNFDKIIINAFRDKKSTKGTVVNQAGHIISEVQAWPIFYNNQFKGVIASYGAMERDSNNITNLYRLKGNENTELKGPFKEIIGESENIKNTLLMAQRASQISSTVMIQGESGTGKGLVAEAIHNYSQRKDKPFVIVNCGAIPSNLLETELFGHEQGAFTGAIKRKIGKFELANGGTIFLDEIGDLPLEMQVKLLRVIQGKKFERVGGNETLEVNVKIISATNKNLEKMVEEGRFREDLYYRLNVITLRLPSLRDRIEDISLLTKHIISKISQKMDKSPIEFSKEALIAMGHYHWPGNIRELENLIERIIALSDKEIVEIYDLPDYISNIYDFMMPDFHKTGLINMNNMGCIATLEEYEREIIKSAINKFGSFNAAGKALGITHKTVAFKARKYNIID
jgi:transcriptional regulator with PAS, ATPase and Fis domain